MIERTDIHAMRVRLNDLHQRRQAATGEEKTALRNEGKALEKEIRAIEQRPARCLHCRETADRLLLFAALRDLGCSTSVDPVVCPARDGGEHEF